MKKILMILALVGVACARTHDGAGDTTHYGAPQATDSVVAKIAPDTLVNEKGQKCVVSPAAKWEGVSEGDSYQCGWQ
jgi:hypothetical protein